jgi:hypothetical protein
MLDRARFHGFILKESEWRGNWAAGMREEGNGFGEDMRLMFPANPRESSRIQGGIQFNLHSRGFAKIRG